MMRALVCVLAPVAMIAACATIPPERSPAPAPVPQPPPQVQAPAPKPAGQRAAVGVIESASVVALPSSSAAGGGTAAGPTMGYRIRMPDGNIQSVVQTGERLEPGDEVQIAPDGRWVRR